MTSVARPLCSPSPAAGVALERVACNLCGGRDHALLYRKPDTRYWTSAQEFDAVRCRGCGLGFVNPRPTREAMRAFYPPRFYERRGVEDEGARYERQARYLDGLPPGRVLDIGCAGGAFLKVLAERGWQPSGMDLFESGNEHGFPLRYGDLPALAYPADHFDAVTAWAVFEHLHDPAAYFREVGRLLRPGGRFVCLVTNLRSVWSRLAYGEDIPRHLYFYSPATLRRYAALGGLRVRRIEYSTEIFPPDSTDVFRVRLLRGLGYGWPEIHGRGAAPGLDARALARAARLLGVVLMRPRLLAVLGLGGIVVATLEKPR